MSEGSYSATIIITAPEATNSPQTVPGSLTINPATPGPPNTTIDSIPDFVNYAPSISGAAIDTAGGTIAGVEMRIQHDTSYWDGNQWQSGEQWIDAQPVDGAWGEASEYWKVAGADLPDAADLEDGDTYTVRARAIDDEHNVDPSPAVKVLAYDITDPDTTIGEIDDHVTDLISIAGGSTDASPGYVARVEVRIQRSGDNYYWTGTSWTTSAVWIIAQPADDYWNGASEDWEVTAPYKLPAWQNGVTYYIEARAVDAAGNEDASPAAESFTFEAVTPTPTATPTPTPTPGLTAEGIITPAGGVVTSDDGRVTLNFPPGAVSGETTVTIQFIPCNTAPEGFRPGNTCFSITAVTDGVPITLLGAYVSICVDYTDYVAAASSDPHSLDLVYYDETTGEWVVLDTTANTSLGIVCSYTNHLSDWMILALTPSVSSPLWVWPVIGLLIALLALFGVTISRRVFKRAQG